MVYPHPKLSPREVVRIQANALEDNDRVHPDWGIEVVWRFASPANKQYTGPLERFTEMVKNPLYAPMLNHLGAEVEGAVTVGPSAQVDVTLKTRHGYARYRFVLRRQVSGEFAGCWMTDSVGPVSYP